MMLFILTSFLGCQMHMAVGTSVFIMTFTAFTGSVSHFVFGFTEIGIGEILLPLCLCIVFTLGFALLASLIANHAKPATLNRIVGGVLVVTGVSLFIVERIRA